MSTAGSIEHSVVTPRTGRYYSLGAVENATSVWVVLHGYGQLAGQFIADFETIADTSRAIVAPEALSRFYLRAGQGAIGANWMTSQDRHNEIVDYINYLDNVIDDIQPSPDTKIVLMGFSQGAATACRWFANSKHELEGLIIWAGGIPPDLDFDKFRSRLGESRMFFVSGDSDIYMSDSRYAAELKSLDNNDIPYEAVRFEGAHSIPADVLINVARQIEPSR